MEKKDIRLFKLVSKLTGGEKTNILLDQPRGKELAEEFYEFFLQMIVKIQSALNGYNLFKSTVSEVQSKLSEFNVLDKSVPHCQNIGKLQTKYVNWM